MSNPHPTQRSYYISDETHRKLKVMSADSKKKISDKLTDIINEEYSKIYGGARP